MNLRVVLSCFVGLGVVGLLALCRAADGPVAAPPKEVTLEGRAREADAAGEWRETSRSIPFAPAKSAILICDMWDRHWCAGASRRGEAIAKRLGPLVEQARAAGMKIVHCPSDTMAFYDDSPARRHILAAPQAQPPLPFPRWRFLDVKREGELPIDDADGGCDCQPQCATSIVWKRENPAIQVEPGDAVSQSGQEVYNYLKAEGVDTIFYVGVHLNMCVLGRSFGIRQMTDEGFKTMLVRDLTDTMYNPRSRPQVDHDRGTQLVIEHVEKHWAPTITCDELTKAIGGLTPAR